MSVVPQEYSGKCPRWLKYFQGNVADDSRKNSGNYSGAASLFREISAVPQVYSLKFPRCLKYIQGNFRIACRKYEYIYIQGNFCGSANTFIGNVCECLPIQMARKAEKTGMKVQAIPLNSIRVEKNSRACCSTTKHSKKNFQANVKINIIKKTFGTSTHKT